MDVKPGVDEPPTKPYAEVKAIGRARGPPCCICHGAIDYDLDYPDPMSCSVQHIMSRKLHPELTWVKSNWAPGHLVCNQSAGDGTANPYDLGVTSL